MEYLSASDALWRDTPLLFRVRYAVLGVDLEIATNATVLIQDHAIQNAPVANTHWRQPLFLLFRQVLVGLIKISTHQDRV